MILSADILFYKELEQSRTVISTASLSRLLSSILGSLRKGSSIAMENTSSGRMIRLLLLLALVASEVVVLPVLGNWAFGGGGGDDNIQCPKGVFVIGDSLADTGNTQAAFPGVAAAILNYPYGMSYTFTDKPGRNRYSDGRLVIDFLGKCTLLIVAAY